MLKSALVAVLLALALPASAAADRAWQAPVPISVAGAPTQAGTAVVTPSGETVAMWAREGGLMLAVKPAGGAPALPVVLDPNGSKPALAADGAGNVIAVWLHVDFSSNFVRTYLAVRPPAGSFGAPVDLGESNSISSPAVAANAEGEAVIAYDNDDRLKTAFRPAGGEFGAPVAVRESVTQLGVALAGGGRAVLVWGRPVPPE